MTLWQFQRRLTGLLLGWAAASIGTGLALMRGDDPLRRGVGEQSIGWGVVNALIALIGRRPPAEANALVEVAARKRTLSRLLWLNTGLDVLYVWGGWRLMRGRGATDTHWRGRGLGIVLQGGVLFFFDLINALVLRRVPK
jgi:hypothetical protein